MNANAPTDVLGRDLYVGAHVGAAFKNGSSGYLRTGVIDTIDARMDSAGRPETFIKVLWDTNGVLSPNLTYSSPERWVIL